MRSRMDSNVGPGQWFLGGFPGYVLLTGVIVLMGCILLPASAGAISDNLVTTMLICAAVIGTAVTGYGLSLYRPGPLGRRSSGRPTSERQLTEGSRGCVKTWDDRRLSPGRLPENDRLNNGLGGEPMLDSAVDRIVRCLEQDLGMRK